MSLIRLGSVTHGFNQNQAVADVGFAAEGAGLRLFGLGDPNVTPPGHYMMFVVDDDGVPSEARILRLRDESGPRVMAAQLLVGKKKNATQIAITFNEPIPAGDSRNFEVRVAGRDRRFKTADDLILTLPVVRYDPSARAVLLTLPARLPRKLSVMLTVVGQPVGGITDLLGHCLDGNADGIDGDDFVTILNAGRRRR